MKPTHPRDITGRDDCVGIAELCAFSNPVYTAEGTITPTEQGFELRWKSENRAVEICAKAETAVRRLRKKTISSVRKLDIVLQN
jgi:hypothetical protein